MGDLWAKLKNEALNKEDTDWCWLWQYIFEFPLLNKDPTAKFTAVKIIPLVGNIGPDSSR